MKTVRHGIMLWRHVALVLLVSSALSARWDYFAIKPEGARCDPLASSGAQLPMVGGASERSCQLACTRAGAKFCMWDYVAKGCFHAEACASTFLFPEDAIPRRLFNVYVPAVNSCGDAVRDIGEACDDGNTNDGDGCSASCAVETGYTCMGGTARSADTCLHGSAVFSSAFGPAEQSLWVDSTPVTGSARGSVEYGAAFARTPGSSGVRLTQTNASVADAALPRAVTTIERVVPQDPLKKLSEHSHLSYWFNARSAPTAVGAVLWATLIECSSAGCGDELLPTDVAPAVASGGPRFFRACVGKVDDFGKDCDVQVDARPGEWMHHTWNVAQRFKAKYNDGKPAPERVKLQFATYGGAKEFHYDLDDFESSSDNWARRSGGITTDIKCSNVEPDKPFRGNCANYFNGMNFRNFELSDRNFEATQSRGGYYTRDFPMFCLALKKQFVDTPVSMLVYTRSLLEQQRNNGEQYYSRSDNWRTIDINTCLAAPADKKNTCSWRYQYGGTFTGFDKPGGAITPTLDALTWKQACIDLDAQLNKNLGPGHHSVMSVIFHTSVSGGPKNTNYANSKFWLDDFEIKSKPLQDDAEVWIDEIAIDTLDDVEVTRQCQTLVASARSEGVVAKSVSAVVGNAAPFIDSTATATQIVTVDPTTLLHKETQVFRTFNSPTERTKLANFIQSQADGTIVLASSNDMKSPTTVLLDESFNRIDSWNNIYASAVFTLTPRNDARSTVEHNIALGQPIDTSTSAREIGGRRWLNDGVKSCASRWNLYWRSAPEPHAWVRVDLVHGRPSNAPPAVDRVVVYGMTTIAANTASRQDGVKVMLGNVREHWFNNAQCGSVMKIGGSITNDVFTGTASGTARCGGRQGRYVFVVGQSTTSRTLDLCEIEVFAQTATQKANLYASGSFRTFNQDIGFAPVAVAGQPTRATTTVSATTPLSTTTGAETGTIAFDFGAQDVVHVNAPKFRPDNRCGQQISPGAVGNNIDHSTCEAMNPESGCCNYQHNTWGYCGNTPQHCECKSCKDQRAYPQDELKPSADTYVDESKTGTNFGTSKTAEFGIKSSKRKDLLLKFDTTALAGKGKKVKGAMLKMFVASEKDCGHWAAFPITEAWDETTVTWNNKPAANESAVLFKRTDRPRSGWGHSNDVRYVDRGKYAAAGLAAQIQRWIDDPTSNHGMLIKRVQNGRDFVKINTKEFQADKFFAPRLEIQYEYDVSNESNERATELATKFTFSAAQKLLDVIAKTVDECSGLCYRSTDCAAWVYNQATQVCTALTGFEGREVSFQHTSGQPLLWQKGGGGLALEQEWTIEASFKLPLKRGQELYTLTHTHDGLHSHASFRRRCTAEADTAYSGSLLETLSLSSQDLCCSRCNTNAQCVAYTYDTAAQQCELKENVGTKSSAVGKVSGQNGEVDLGIIFNAEFQPWNLTDTFNIETSQAGVSALGVGWHRLTIVGHKNNAANPNGFQTFHIDGAHVHDASKSAFVGTVDRVVTEGVYAVGNQRDAHETASSRAPWGALEGFRVYRQKFRSPRFLQNYFAWRIVTDGIVEPWLPRFEKGTVYGRTWNHGPKGAWWMARGEDRRDYGAPLTNQHWARQGAYLVFDDVVAMDWTDVSIETRFKQESSLRGIGVLFRYVDERNYYRFAIESEGQSSVDFERMQDGVLTQLKFDVKNLPSGNTPFTISRGQWYDLRIDVLGSNFKAFIDNQLVLEATDPTPLPKGTIALWTWYAYGSKWDNVRVVQYSSKVSDLRSADANAAAALKTVGVTQSQSIATVGGAWASIGFKSNKPSSGVQQISLQNGTQAIARYMFSCPKTTRSVVENSPVGLRVSGALSGRAITRENGRRSFSTGFRVKSVTDGSGVSLNATNGIGSQRHVFAADRVTGELLVQHSAIDFEKHSMYSIEVAAQESGFDSGWFVMKSQAADESFRRFQHSIGESSPAQLHVRILTRALDGPNAGYVFHGSGSAMNSDVYEWASSYGGLLFGYDENELRLWAPANPVDKSLCYNRRGTFSESRCNSIWSHRWMDSSIIRVGFGFGGFYDLDGKLKGEHFHQVSGRAQVRASVQKDQPASYDSGWFQMSSEQGSGSFAERFHGLTNVPSRVKVIARALDGPNKGFVFEGTGSQQGDDDNSYQPYAGLLFGYSKDSVRVWAPDHSGNELGNSEGYMISTGPGWGAGNFDQRSATAEVRILAWEETDSPDYDSGWIEMTANTNDAFKEFSHGLGELPEHVQVQVKAIDGANLGYYFDGVGSSQRNTNGRYRDYGGVIFGYSENTVRVWAPTANPIDGTTASHGRGKMIRIGDGWGGERHTQNSNVAHVRVRAWKQFGGLESSQRVEVQVKDVNEPPVTSDVNSILPEDVAVGTQAAIVQGNDDDAGTKLSFNITSGNTDGDFSIITSGKKGIISVAKALDFERTNLYRLKVTVSDGNALAISTVTIVIGNENDKPVIDDATLSIIEEAPVNALVGPPLNGTDGDLDQTILFKIIDGNVGGAFKISGCGGQIRVAKSIIDYEARTQYILRVSLTDDGVPPLNDTATITVNVINKNDPPQFAPQSRAIVENSAVGSPVDTPLTVFDPDGDALVFDIEFGNEAGMFSIDNATGQLRMAVFGPDYELPTLAPTYKLRVRVTDTGSPPLTNVTTVTVVVNNTNDAPIFPDATRFVAENVNMANATTVGAEEGVTEGEDPGFIGGEGGEPTPLPTPAPAPPTFRVIGSPLKATDQDARACLTGELQFCGDTLTYSIFGTSIFDIDSTTGQLTLENTHALDFESVNQYEIVVLATDKTGAVTNSTVTVQVQDLNDPPTLSEKSFTVQENSAAKTQIGSVLGTDADEVQCQKEAREQFPGNSSLVDLQAALSTCPTVTYAIAGGDLDSSFAIDPQTAMLSVKAANIDFERRNSYTLSISATDDGVPSLQMTTNVFVTVADVNDPPIASCNTSLPQVFVLRPGENGVFASIAEPDQADGLNTFSFGSPATEDGCRALCESEPACMVFTFFRSSYFRVQWRGKCFGRSNKVANTFSKEDATVISGVRTTPCERYVIAENSANALVVGSAFVATDPDKNAITYSIKAGNIGNAFVLQSSHKLAVANSSALDFETLDGHAVNLTIAITDNGSPPMTTDMEVQVALADINEPPSFVDTSRTIVRNAELNDAVGAPVVAFDQDAGDIVQYTIVGVAQAPTPTPNPSRKVIAGPISYFGINTTSGQLFLKQPFSAAVLNEAPFDVSVRVSDGELPHTGHVVVNVEDANFPPEIEDHSLSFDEGTRPVGAVYQVPVKDKNTEQQHTWKLLFGLEGTAGVDGAGTFDIDSDGKINLLASAELDFEKISAYVLTVLVEDQPTNEGESSLSDTAKITIVINDVNEAPVVPNVTLFIDENTGQGNVPLTLVGSEGVVECHDDDNDPMTFAVVSGNAENSFTLVQNASTFKLAVSAGAQLDHEKRDKFVIAVSATDGTLTGTGFITIKINDVNEAPVVQNALFKVEENTLPSFSKAVGTVQFTDEDDTDITVNFAIVAGDTAGFFFIDENRGSIYVQKTGLDFEAVPVYNLTVRATDKGGLHSDGIITVHLEDVNDIEILSVGVKGVGNDRLMNTLGSQTVSLKGTNYGSNPSSISATYSNAASGRTYSATGCHLATVGDIECTTVAGSGIGPYTWHLTINTVPSPYTPGTWLASSTDTLSYAPPVISSLSGHQGMSTRGGADITINGENFGPIGTSVSAHFKSNEDRSGRVDFFALNCTVTIASTKITCQSPSGAGGALKWQVDADGQLSSFSQPDSFFALPSIVTLDNKIGGRNLKTSGNEIISISGQNFGPDHGYVIEALYGNDTSSGKPYVASCILTQEHTHAECSTVPGIGKQHLWKLRVAPTSQAQQLSASGSVNRTSYRVPEIVSVTGQGSRNANTEGGQQIVLFGSDFGPLDSVVIASYGRAASTYAAVACKITTAHTRAECLTAPGTGFGHIWTIKIGNQLSPPCTKTPTNYGTPFISTITGAGAADAITDGGQKVVIKGGNFGPIAHKAMDNVTYGPTGKEFVASSCSITTDHQVIECDTAVGGGFKLKWVVNVDGQASTQPTTYYALPVITKLSPPSYTRSVGNDTVLIHGANFATDELLESVTYGWSGNEYTCHSARVQKPHRTIECQTQAGFGEGLSFLVTVAGQTNVFTPAVALDYAQPNIIDISPKTGSTSGGLTVQLTGDNFGPKGTPKIFFDGRQEPVKEHEIDVAGRRHTLKFRLPPGYGKKKNIHLQLGENAIRVLSNSMTFQYDPPKITKLTVTRKTASLLELTVFGEGFGLEFDPVTRDRTAAMLVDGKIQGTEFSCTDCFSHRRVEVLYNRVAGALTGTVQIVVGDPSFFADLKSGASLNAALLREENNAQISNMFNFSHFSPTITSMVSDPSTVTTEGGGKLTVKGTSFGINPLVKVGGQNCNPLDPAVPVAFEDPTCNAASNSSAGGEQCTQVIECTLPPIFGKMEVIVSLGGMASAPRFIEALAPTLSLADLHAPTIGDTLTLDGASLGTSGLLRIMSRDTGRQSVLNITEHDHKRIVVHVPPGEGAEHILELTLMPTKTASQAKISLDLDAFIADYTKDEPGKQVVGKSYRWRFSYDAPQVVSFKGELGSECELIAQFASDPGAPSGNITFSRGLHYSTSMNIALDNLEDAVAGNKFHVHLNGADGRDAICNAAGGHFDPTNAEVATGRCKKFFDAGLSNSTFDKAFPPGFNASNISNETRDAQTAYAARMAADCFYAGDIAGKFGNLFGPSVIGRQVVDSTGTLPLRDLIGKSIVLHKASGAKWACATIRVVPGQEQSCSAGPVVRSDGSTIVTINGRNFGAPSLHLTAGQLSKPAVTLGEAKCEVQSWGHTELQCKMGVAPNRRVQEDGSPLPLQVGVANQIGSYEPGVAPAQQAVFAPPKLWSFTPANGPTRGKTIVNGVTQPVIITVTGDDLGANNETAHALGLNEIRWLNDLENPLIMPNPCADVTKTGCLIENSLSHTGFQFRLPPTDGSAVVVELNAIIGDQRAAQGLDFHYDPPQITGLSPALGPTSGFVLDRSSGLSSKFMLTIKGKNFGTTQNIEVIIGKPELFDQVPCGHPFKLCITHSCGAGAVPPCVVVPLDSERRHEEIQVYPGPGYGADLSVVVRLRAKQSAANTRDNYVSSNSWPYAYNPPQVDFVSPNPSDAHGDLFALRDDFKTELAEVQQKITLAQERGDTEEELQKLDAELNATRYKLHKCTESGCMGKLIQFMGSDFGETSSPLYILLNGHNCSDPTWRKPRDRPYLECLAPPSIVGYANVTIHVADQTTEISSSQEKLLRSCEAGYYGQFGETCLPCPPGAICDGEYNEFFRNFSEPVAQEFWWRYSPDIGSVEARQQCNFDRQTRPEGYGECHYFVPCEPKESCEGYNNCAIGYTGQRCSECAKGFFRRTGECVPCPDCPICIVILFIGIGVLGGTVGYILSRKNIELGIVAIGVDYFQVLSMLARTKVAWPPAVMDLYYWLSAFNLNLELLAPECSYDIDFEDKWVFIEMMPVALISIFLCVHFAKAAHKKFIQGRTAKIHSHGHRVVGFSLMCFYFLYLYLTRTTLEIWNCQETDPPDGHEYMQAVFVRCYEPGGLQQRLLPWSVIFFLGYTVAYPLLVGFILFKNKSKVQEDQLLRAKGTGQSRATNPNCHDFRKRYKDIYYRFKPRFFYWTMVIIVRKFCIAACALLFRKTPAFQLACMQLVMFTSYALQVRNNPYMSEAEKPMVVLAYQMELDKNAFGMSLKSGVAGALKNEQEQAGKTHMRKKVAFGSSSAMDKLRDNKQAPVAYFWNYNTVEAVLLCCGVLVTLAGVMFQSGKLAGQKDTADALAYAVLVVIIVSILYFVLVLTTEIFIGLGWYKPHGKAPKAQEAATATNAEDAQLQLRMKKMERHLSTKRSMVGSHTQEAAHTFSPDDLIDDEEMEMPASLNPLHADNREQNAFKEQLKTAAQNEAEMAQTIEQLQNELRLAKKASTANQLRGYSGTNLRASSSRPGGLANARKSSRRMNRAGGFGNGGAGGTSGPQRKTKQTFGGQSDVADASATQQAQPVTRERQLSTDRPKDHSMI